MTDNFVVVPGEGDQLIFVSGTGSNRRVMWLTRDESPMTLHDPNRDRDRAILRALLGLAQTRLDAIEADGVGATRFPGDGEMDHHRPAGL